jgi:hypothetical protein
MRLVNARQLAKETQLSARTMFRIRSAGKWELGINPSPNVNPIKKRPEPLQRICDYAYQ